MNLPCEDIESSMASSKNSKNLTNKFLDAVKTEQVKQAAPVPKDRSGWTPGATWDESKKEGTLVTDALQFNGDTVKDWDQFLIQEGFDPAHFYIDADTMKYRTWTGVNGDKMVHYNVTIKKRRASYDAEFHKKVIADAGRFKPKKNWKPAVGDQTFVVVFADWQTGKSEGEGLKGLVDRVTVGIQESLWRYNTLTKAGYKFDEVLFLCLGDIVEGCSGFYEMQEFSVELSNTEQIQAAYALMKTAVVEFAKLGPEVKILSVPGNHGEFRNAGKAYTSFMDNKDLHIAFMLDEFFKSNPKAFPNVECIYPNHRDDDIVLTYETKGKLLGLAHGHQFRSGGGALAVAKAQTWHKNQMYGDYNIGFADILVYGHYHHFTMIEDPKIIIGAPALDGGSKWIENTHGKRTKPGILTFCIDKDGLHNLYKCEKKVWK